MIGNPASDTVSIDDLPTVTIQATTPTAQEHELTPGAFTVTRANDPLVATQALTVTYTISGSAANGMSYHTLSGSVTIAAGQATATINLTPIDAGLVGGSQTVTLTLAPGTYLIPGGGSGDPPPTGASDTVTIEDDDPPTVSIQATTPTASELGASAGVFTVTRNGATTDPLTVSYNVSGTATAGTSYEALSGSVTIPAGQATAIIDATPIDIGQIGGTATVVLGLAAGADYAVGTPASDTVTILENDLPTVTLAATQANATESGTTGTFTVSRNGATTNPLIVLYSIGGTASDGADYQALPGYLTIPAGQSSATITITPINDPLVEQDQTVVVTLASTSQYLAGSQHSDTVTIFDDNPPSVTVAATADADEQTNTAGSFTVTRLGPTDDPLSVSYTVGGTAQSGTDFSPFGTSVTIPAGQSSATITVTPLDDGVRDEVQQIVVPEATGGSYTLTIGSDTTAPLAYNADATAVQAALELLPEVGTGNVTVSGQGSAADPFVVTFAGGLVDVSVPQITGDGSQLTGVLGYAVTTVTPGDNGVDQVEQVGFTATGSVTGGTFTLSYNGHTTWAIAYNASADQVQEALEALSNIGVPNVTATAISVGPEEFAWQVTFVNSLARQAVPQITTNPSGITVSGGSAAANDSTITTGTSQGTDAVQQVTVSGAGGGTFTLARQGAATAPIAYNATAGEVAGALEALQNIGNNVAVSGNPGGPWTVTFQGSLADQAIQQLTIGGSGLTPATVTTSIVTAADGDSMVVLTLATSTAYSIGTLAAPTASGGTGASDTLTIADNGNVAPTVQTLDWSTDIGQTLSTGAPGVLAGAEDATNATLTAVLLTGVADGTLTLNADGSFSYTPDAGFQGTDSFVIQAYNGTTYSAPMVETISVVPVPAPQIGVSDGGTDVADGGSVDFGLAWVGTPVTQTITITNNGTADLTLDPSSLVLPADFSLVTPFASDVAAGESTTLVVQMDAAAVGTYSGAASFNWGDDQNSDEFGYSITLSGTVSNPAPVLEVLSSSGSPLTESFDFGTTGQGEPLTDLFTIENTGTADLVLSDPISLASGFTLSADFGATTLSPGATTTFAVELTATATGSYSGNIGFNWGDDQNSSEFNYTLPISGTVVASPVVEVLDGEGSVANGEGTVDFGTALLGTAVTQTLTIDNNGTTVLNLDPTQLVLPAGFSVLTPYATSVAPGGSTTLTLEIDGSTADVFSGAASFPTNDVDNPTFTFQVTGEIDTPEPKLELFDGALQITAGATVDFGTTPVGTPVDLTLTVENAGSADLNLPSAIGLPTGFTIASWNGSTEPPSGATDVAPGDSATITLELSADFADSYSGTASIYTNDPASQPFSFNLTGVVGAPQVQVTGAGNVIVGGVDAGSAGNPPAAVDFGDTDLNSPLAETFTVTNVGSEDLSLLDPIVVPYGFSVTSDFGTTTLAPDASTTFTVQLDADATGAYQGTLAFESNDPDQALFYFAVSGQVATPVMQVSDGAIALTSGGSDDFGNTPQGTAVVRTLNISNTGSGTLTLSDPISLPSGFTLMSDFGSTSLAPGDSTSFTVELDAASAGFYSGNVAFGNNATTGGTFQVAVSGGVAVPRFEVLEGTTDVTNAASPVDLGETVVGTPRSATFTVQNNGTDNLILSDPISLPAGFTLTQDFSATAVAPGGSATFTVELPATTAGDYSGSISFGTNLGNIPTYSLPIQGEVIGMSGFQLWNDTGFSSTDDLTSDPTVAGNLVGVEEGSGFGVQGSGTVEVQFSVDGGTTINGSIQANSALPFTFPPVGLTDGPVTVDARVQLVDAVMGNLYTDWVPLSFTLESGTDAAPVVTNLALQTVTVPSASTPTSSDATIIGSVLHDGNVAYMTVQIDATSSGKSDTTVTTDANGNFVYQPQKLSPGTYTYHFRAIENAYPSGEIDGPWVPFTFVVVAPNPPVVDKLALADVTGPGANTTTDPTLTGHVTADGNPQQVTVEFDYTGQGVADASTTANADGTFTFKPVGLALGSVTIHVRAVNADDSITGNWTSLTFTLATPQAPIVSTLALANVTGGANSGVTDDPTVTGTLSAANTGDPSITAANVTVQFDTNGDGLPDGSTTTDQNGNFTWTPSGVHPGTVTIGARAVYSPLPSGEGQGEGGSSSVLYGTWKSISFTYSTSAGPVVSSLSLAHPTGVDSATGLSTAIDPTLVGTLTNGTGLASFLTVQYELSGSTTPDGSTMTDAKGNFTLGLSGLSPGTQTIEVRGVTRDPQTGTEVDGDWKTIQFDLDQNPISDPPVTPADSNALTTADEVAATSKQADVQAVDAGIQTFNAAMGATSTPTGEISVGIGTYTALADMLGGSVVSGSIFGVENGSLPAPAGVGSGSGNSGSGSGVTGPSLPGSTPAGLSGGTPLDVSNLATPVAGSGTIVNEPVTANGALGPGSANLMGLLNGSWNITVAPDPNSSNITDWTVTISLTETFENDLAGSYTDTDGAATLDHDYTDDLGGSYSFTFQASGTTTQTSAGSIIAGIYDDSTDDGHKDDDIAGGVETDTGTDEFSEDDKDHSTFNEADSGQFTGAASGTYSDTHSTDDTTTDDESGTTTTAANGATTDGSYDDEVDDITNDTSQATEQQGTITSNTSHTDYSKTDDTDDGTFDDTPAGDTIDGSFDDKKTDLTTDSGSQTNNYPGGTSTQSGYDGRLEKDTSDGSETGNAGGPTDTGEATDDTLEVDGGMTSDQYPFGNGTHTDLTSGSDVDKGHAGGDFSTSGGAVSSEDMKYSDDDKAKYHEQYSNSSSSPNALGGTSSYSDGLTQDDKSKHDDNGERDITPGGAGQSPSTVDDGTATDTSHDVGSYFNQTVNNSPTGGSTIGYSSADTSDSRKTDNYDITGSSRTDDDTFDNEDRPQATWTDLANYSAPGDPGTNSSLSDIATTKGDNVDDGTEDETNGTVTDETDNFDDETKSTDVYSMQANSDVGSAGNVVTASVPWIIPGVLGSVNIRPIGGQWAPIGFDVTQPATWTTTSNAKVSSNDTETDHADGTTTDRAGTINTDEKFDDKDVSDYSDSQSLTSTGSYNTSNGAGSKSGDETVTTVLTDGGDETDDNDGTIDGGVTTDDYKNKADETTTMSNIVSYNASESYVQGSLDDSHGIVVTTAQQITKVSEDGDYTSEPPGQTAQKTADNPNGDATSEQTIDSATTVTNNQTQHIWGDHTDPTKSLTGDWQYGGTGTSMGSSDSTVDVNAAAGTDTQSGNYGGEGKESQWSNYTESGRYSFLPYQTGTWSFQGRMDHSGYINDNGQFGGSETDTSGQTNSDSYLEVTTTQYHVGSLTYSGGSIISGGTGGGTNGSETDPAASAPVDGSAGNAPGTVPIYDMSGLKPEASGAWDGYWSNVGRTAKGYFWDAPSGIVTGLAKAAWNQATDPVGTAIKQFQMVRHPLDTLKGIKDHYVELSKTPEGQGAIAFEVTVTVLTAGDALAGTAGKSAFLGKSAATAEAVEVAAAEGSLATRGAAEAESLLGSCFPAGTPIATADGLAPIEAVRAGQRVWAYDLVAGVWRLCSVLRSFRREYEGHSTFVTVDGETIESTLLHPYWVVSGEDLDGRPRREHLPSAPDGATTLGRWVDAGDLHVGDRLLLRDGRIMPIEAVRTAPYHGLVYNFAVAELECYAVGRGAVLVHNINGAEAVASDAVASDAAAFGRYRASLAQQEIANAQRVGSALKSDPLHRAPTFVVDEIGEKASVFALRGADGVERTLVQMPGVVNGEAGVFEWILDANGSLVHQRFIRGAPVSGIPNINPSAIP